MFTTLIDTDTLAAHLVDPAFAIVDCRYRLDDEDWGSHEYRRSHIPGAPYADLLLDLSGSPTGTNGRHPLPDPAALAKTLGRLGIDRDVQVIAYDQDTGLWASRLWWLLRWLGHDAVAVLDGGFAKWLTEARPIASGEERRAARTFAARIRPGISMDASAVAARSTDPAWRILDARAPERYRGEIEPIDRVPGHIPGAVNHFFKRSLRDDATFHSRAELRARLDEVLSEVSPEQVVCYCGSGVTACHNLLALEHAGLRGAKLYPGSWSEWSSDPSRPIETTKE